MGNVFLVHHPRTAGLLAAKEMNKIGVKDLAVRFDRECRYMQECVHPALVRYVDQGITSEGSPYLVMRYLPEGSLQDLIDRNRSSRAPTAAVPMILSVLEGLIYFHGRGLIHRDIKPANILLDSEAGTTVGCARLADFGLAYNYARAGELRITRRNTPMG